MELFINDELVDLSDDSPIALTFQINNLAEVRNQQGNTSNQFKLPLTQRNRRILGFPDDVAFCTDLPYQKYRAKLVQDGLEIIPYGVAELNSVDNDTASVTILSGNVDFFDAIEGKLYDMGDTASAQSKYRETKPWKQYDHTWDLDNVVNSQDKTEGWIYPVIDYGNLADHPAPVNVNYLRPGFFIKTAIDLMVKSAGYQAKGSLLTDPLYDRLIAQFSNSSWEHGTDYQNAGIDADPLACEVKTGANKVLSGTRDYTGNLKFTDVSNDLNHLWHQSSDSYSAPASVSVGIQFSFSVTVTGDPKSKNNEGEPVGIKFYLMKYRDEAHKEELNTTYISLNNEPKQVISASPFGSIYQHRAANAKLAAETDLLPDEVIYIRYVVTNSNKGSVLIDAGATLSITPKKQRVLYGQQVQCERIFPDITQKDLLKDTLQRFGIICQTDNANRTISFNSFRDIVANTPIAKNWTKKCLDQGKAISFQLGGYAQVNHMKYKEDDAILPTGFGDSYISIADATLPASADMMESQFAPSFNTKYLDGSVAQVKMIADGDTDLSISVTPRILIDQKLNIGGKDKTITFTDGRGNNRVVNDVISAPYFYKPDAPNITDSYGTGNLKFDALREKYYPELEKILKHTKKVIRYFLLTPRDILELDLLIPVYLEQDSAYYYINKIEAWRKGLPVKVELMKLG